MCVGRGHSPYVPACFPTARFVAVVGMAFFDPAHGDNKGGVPDTSDLG